MGADTLISWADDTFNPWWGCTRVSPGCTNCYAERLATVRRKLPVWGVDAERKPMSAAHWRLPEKWNREAEAAGQRRRVFCASMADVFELLPERNVHASVVVAEARTRLWALIERTPWLDWLLLTKRPENVRQLVPWGSAWPRNVWLGTTVEDNVRRERLNVLREIPARVRFCSYEPAVEGVNFNLGWLKGIHWLIIGGESGPGARPFDVSWARFAIRAALDQGTIPFVKQLGARPLWGPFDSPQLATARSVDGKWGTPSEWPEDLRVQGWPLATA